MLKETAGCAAALGSAAAWAYSSILFRKIGDKVSPAGMNLANSAIGLVYMGLALAAIGLAPVDQRSFFVLGASGLLGIALGGVLFFRALMCLGPRLMMLTGLSVPPATVLLAVFFLNERPPAAAWAGSLLVFTGIALAVWKPRDGGSPRRIGPGLTYAGLSAACTALSIVLAKTGVAEVPALQASFIRHLWAAAALAGWGLATGGLKGWLAPFGDRRLLKLTAFSVFVVIFGGFWLSMVALKFTYASVATILNMTEPLFILPLTALLLKEKVTARELAGAAVAFAGVILIFLR
jgi:drug/metabolite transporter (DMT)-like permease